MPDDLHRSEECTVQMSFPNGLHLTASAPISVVKHILVCYAQEEAIPGWLVHALLVAAEAEGE
jgi:hypothetical protein